jgi:nucleoside-diphosphate-sugar epimerase
LGKAGLSPAAPAGTHFAGQSLPGFAPNRCKAPFFPAARRGAVPTIGKLAALGYRRRTTLDQGLPSTIRWYCDNEQLAERATASAP